MHRGDVEVILGRMRMLGPGSLSAFLVFNNCSFYVYSEPPESVRTQET